jgi:hypothetical protein
MPALTQDPLLHRVMETTPVRDEGLERLLASTRTMLLDAALDPSSDIAPEMLPLCCALARQCFINEYVFHLPDVEHDGMVALRGKLMSDLSGTTPVYAITLLAYACYAPLATLDRAAAIRSSDTSVRRAVGWRETPSRIARISVRSQSARSALPWAVLYRATYSPAIPDTITTRPWATA